MQREYENEGLPLIEGIDWEYALSLMKDAVLLKETAENFVKMSVMEKSELEKCFATIDCACDAEALNQYRIRVHSMKNSAAMIGAVFVSDRAKELEYAARDEDIEKIQKQHADFLVEWDALTERLREHFDRTTETKELLKPDVAAITEYLKKLDAAMTDFDLDTADEMIRELSRYHYADEERDIFIELEVAVQNLDQSLCASCTKRWMNLLSGTHA